MEEESAALREMQAKVAKEMGSVQDPAASSASQANREEIDSRSVFVGNVRPLAFSYFACFAITIWNIINLLEFSFCYKLVP
ncbi:hypothetical protein SLEP1_g11031 [Rubroshorea leprosula]|nr:hypothetical protein SLEP1_g11031 [Rubroshorea leprosula]